MGKGKRKGRRKAKQRRVSGGRDEDPAQPLHYALPTPPLENFPIIFQQRRNIQLGVENKSHVTGRAESGEDDIDDVVRIFMREPEESEGCLPRADKVEEFCFGMSTDALRKAHCNPDGTLRRIAWLDDRNLDGPLIQSRARCKPLTVYELLKELEKPRFPSACPATSLATTTGRATLTDADRRLMFISDLDCYSIYAIVRTASTHQASALRGALYHYLEFEPSLELAAITEGFPTFKLAFHLPFFALKTSKTPQTDYRRDRTGDPLRRSRDVSFLNRQDDASPMYLYDVQASCVISGFDWSRWDAKFFMDTYYFDSEDPSKEDIWEYREDGLSAGGMCADPLTYGLVDADMPIWDPQEYFLKVFQPRFAQALREWRMVVMTLKKSFKHHQSTNEYRLHCPLSGDPSKDKTHTKGLRRSLDWVLLFMDLAKELNETLSKTLRSYEPFCSKRAANCVGGLSFPPANKSLPSIQNTFDELCQHKETLDHLLDRCDQRTKQLRYQLDLEVREIGDEHIRIALEANRIAEVNTGLAWIMIIFVTPVALSSSVFSMQSKVISFIPPTFGSFLALSIMLSFLGFLIRTMWFCWPQAKAIAWQYCCALFGLLRRPRLLRNGPLDEEAGNPATAANLSV
ncbi:uncharacterized protein Z520_02118 [Fonsecaea multimorphosa CBS 102226]|uniref:Uncharacterized protein n=1 Tax=Fonsecaea multimorphosa CBS 102226 TaxID=1442371 RepID=A0A0D2KF36_9EURO|nr:uncharacterized protein Z520_02118 [Fonsecaea multimorphosa CBS 102226]KIY01980.1 hypothetical protein Z520_02118 [Fonsecaea multimorphosa CBS 102226]OAL29662.1 hypothetical protein AYO22_02076 [Fonsecaea multimorphosa]